MRHTQVQTTGGLCNCCEEPLPLLAIRLGTDEPLYCSYACSFFEETRRNDEALMAEITRAETMAEAAAEHLAEINSPPAL